MVGTRDLAALTDAATRALAKLVLVGDDRQLPEIDAGGAFRALAERLGAVELREVRRQREPWDRDALDALRRGDAQRFAETYHAHGRLFAAPTTDAARATLTRDWWRAHEAGERALMIAHRRADVADLNRRARAVLREAGRLGPDALLTGERAFAVGDRVVATRNDRRLTVVNGQTGTLVAVHPGRLHVELDDGRRVDLPDDYARDGLDHAYATTAHRVQARRSTAPSFSAPTSSIASGATRPSRATATRRASTSPPRRVSSTRRPSRCATVTCRSTSPACSPTAAPSISPWTAWAAATTPASDSACDGPRQRRGPAPRPDPRRAHDRPRGRRAAVGADLDRARMGAQRHAATRQARPARALHDAGTSKPRSSTPSSGDPTNRDAMVQHPGPAPRGRSAEPTR